MRRLILILLIAPFLTVRAYAQQYSESAGEELKISQVQESLTKEQREIGGELKLDGTYDAAGALERLWYRFLDSLKESFRESMRSCVAVLGLIFLSSLGLVLTAEQKKSDFVELSSCAAVSCLLAKGLDSAVGSADAALWDLCQYAKAALPAIYSAAAVAGAPSSAAARFAASSMGLDLLMSLSERLIHPILHSFFAMAVCSSFFEHPLLRSCLQLLKKASVILMMGTCLLFTGFLSLTGVVTGSADAAAVKAARTVITAGVPVVGKLMSEAADSILAAASVVKNSAGAFGLVSVAAICLTPFVSLGVKKLLFSFSSAAAEMSAGPRLSRLLGDLSTFMGLLLALLASYGVMLFFSIVCAIRSVGG